MKYPEEIYHDRVKVLEAEKNKLGNLLLETADRNAREIVRLETEVERLREALVEHNARLRSAAAVADGGGKDTNWLAFRAQVHFTLAEYHELANSALAALAGKAEQ